MNRKHAILRDTSLVPGATPEAAFNLGPRTRAEGAEPQLTVEADTLSPSQAADIARDPQVVAVAPVMPTLLVRPFEVAADAAAQTAWGIAAVGADQTNLTGAEVVVAVLDTGIDRDHPAFAGVTLVEEDFSGAGNGDVNGHGTHCAGTIFGRDVAGTRIGVARGINKALIGKVLGNDGRGSSEMIFEAINWASENKADVISMSLGFDFPGLVKFLIDEGLPAELAASQALVAYRDNLRVFDSLMALIRARSPFGSDSVVIAAAGNESQREVDPDFEIAAGLPAAADGVISVAAAGQAAGGLRIADFSNTAAMITGPGVDILSAKVGGGLRSLSGTSMACPHVAGVSALIWEEVRAAAVPPESGIVLSRLLARARTNAFVPGVQVADRGAGMVAVA